MQLIIKGGLHLFLLKGIGDTQSFIGYVLLTNLSFHILFSSLSCAHPSRMGVR